MRRSATAVMLFATILPLFIAVSSCSGKYEDAKDAYDKGDFATAYRIFRPLAEQGRADAQFFLGMMYENGQGVPETVPEAAKWYRKAAEQGIAAAQLTLGNMYYKGTFNNGQGIPQDYSQAFKWYRRAAEQGLPGSQYNLGIMYAKGHGVPQDYVLAHMWFNLAASSLVGAEDREMAAGNRNDMASNMPPDSIAEAQRMAREWMPKKER